MALTQSKSIYHIYDNSKLEYLILGKFTQLVWCHDTIIWALQVTKYTLNATSACFINNRFDDRDVNVTLDGTTHFLPAWSVSILPNCKTVAFNSAKVFFPLTVE